VPAAIASAIASRLVWCGRRVAGLGVPLEMGVAAGAAPPGAPEIVRRADVNADIAGACHEPFSQPELASGGLLMRPRPGALAAVALLLVGGCALFRSSRPEALPDGTYRVRCDKALATCLVTIEPTCRDGCQVAESLRSQQAEVAGLEADCAAGTQQPELDSEAFTGIVDVP